MDNLAENGIVPTDGSWSTGKLSTILKNPIYVRADNDIYEYFLKKNTNIISDISEFDGMHGVQICNIRLIITRAAFKKFIYQSPPSLPTV